MPVRPSQIDELVKQVATAQAALSFILVTARLDDQPQEFLSRAIRLGRAINTSLALQLNPSPGCGT